MKQATTAYITVGKVGSSFGVRGWVKIHSYTEFGAGILNYTPWYLINGTNQEIIEYQIEDSRQHAKGLIVKFTTINTPEEARLLTGKIIAVRRTQLPILKKNEYYWSDLEGLIVIHQDGRVFGKVIQLLETGSNDVLVVKGDKEHAIPYLFGTVILHVDLEKKEIIVDWELI